MHTLCEWKGQEKREGGREWKREREREAGLSVMSRRGREALGEEDVSQHRRELEQWVEEKKREKRERDQSWKGFFFAVLSRLWTCKMDRYDGEKVWLLALCIWLCACTSACVRARAPAVSHQPAWWEEHWMPADWGSALSKVCALFLRLC